MDSDQYINYQSVLTSVYKRFTLYSSEYKRADKEETETR